MANCPGCGGAVRFDIEEQKLKCTACGNLYSPYENDLFIKQEGGSSGNSQTYETTAFICPQCGGELCSSEHDLSGNCAFCGTPVVFESKQVRHRRPEFIIPFGITKEECKDIYAEKVKNNPYAPKELRDPEYIDGFRGIYVPYWVYDVRYDEKFSKTGTRKETHRNYDDVYTDEINGQIDCEFSQIMHDASSVLQDDLSEKVEPYEAVKNKETERRSPDFKEFSEGYFPGFYAEPADVSEETYMEYAKKITSEKTSSYLEEHPKLKKYNLKFDSKKLEMKTDRAKLAMMPVWFLSYRKNNRVAYAAVNGQTGRIVSDMPVDFRVFAKRFGIVAAVFFVLLMFLTILPASVTLLSVVMAFIVTCYCFDDVYSLGEREKDGVPDRLRDTFNGGFTIVIFIFVMVAAVILKAVSIADRDFVTIADGPAYKFFAIIFDIAHLVGLIMVLCSFFDVKKDRTPAYIICPTVNFLAALAGTAVLLFAPANDVWYYLTGIGILFIEMISFFFIIKNHNRIATRPLPQFSVHKGGDDSAG
ncbi:MAG: hypothetical protein J5864_03455 [Oscillospiraceae bacterium]|nr:hypothetical protein [Oscillospiraceae bacterium]